MVLQEIEGNCDNKPGDVAVTQNPQVSAVIVNGNQLNKTKVLH